MKTITGFALGLAAALTVPVAFADEHDTKTKSTTTTESATTTDESMATTPSTDTAGTTTTTTTGTTESMNGGTYSASGSYGYAAPTTAASTTTTTNDFYVHDPKKDDNRPHVRRGLGINAFGAVGGKDSARWGVGGRLEYVMPFGLAFGGSYTQHIETEGNSTTVRPLLAEIGWAFPVAHHVEVRPMVGLGYAFVTGSSGSTTDNTARSNQTANANVAVATSGFDIAPGAKVSYVARAFELYTLPKYHFISGNNFLGVEVGAGARF